MRTALLVAGRDLRGRVRDRSAWVTVFFAPVALASILSLAFGADEDGLALRFALASSGAALADPEARSLIEHVRGSAGAGGLTLTAFDDEAAVRRAVLDEEADAGIVVRPGPPRASVMVVRREDAPISAEVAEAVAHSAALRAATGGRPPMVEQQLRGRSPRSSDYYGPAMAVFFVFFVMAFAPLSLIAERRDGTLARLAASPIRMTAVLAGKGLSVFALAFASVLVVWGVTWAAFGAHWGPPVAVLALVGAAVLAAGGFTTLAAAGARTERQADGQISTVVFLGALLGGNFLPLDALPPLLRGASLFTPNGWAMRGFVELSNGARLADVWLNIAVLVAMALAAAGLAAVRAGQLGVRP